MTAQTIVHLRTETVSVLIDARGDGVPRIAHWGAPLGEPTEADLAATVAGLARPVSPNMPDQPVPLGLLPEYGRAYPGRPGLRGHRAGGASWSPLLRLVDVTATERSATFRCADRAAGLTVTSELELAPSGLLRVRHTVRNDAPDPYTVDGLEVALPVPEQAAELLDFTGRHLRERHPQRHPFAHGSWVRENRRGRTGHDASFVLFAGTPGFDFRHGELWGVHVGWSGNHISYAERVAYGRSVLGGGELLLPGEIELARGESYRTPWVYAAYSDRGIDGVSAAFHQWLRARPRHPDAARPVTLNTWEAVYFEHDLDRLRGLADVAASLGVERFVLDDGWFRHRRDDRAGLGDWYVDETVWPQGLHPLVDHVRGLGMQFGLWVEPEMVNPDSDLFRAHPDWVLAPPDRLPPVARNQQVLDVANPDAYAYLRDRLDALLTEYPIGYVKWDHNRDLVDGEHAGHAGVHAQTTAVYRLLAELRERHPDVEIESCSSGGGRVDLGVLEHTDRVWTSDSNDALERQTIQRWTGVLLPPELMGAHVGPTHSHSSGRTHDLSFRVATALFGHFGLEWDIATTSERERAAIAAAIAYYKQVRGLLREGEVVRAEHPDPAALVHGVVAVDRTKALFCYAQLATSVTAVPPPVRLPGLDPDRRYRVRLENPAGPPAEANRARPGWCEAGEIVLTGRSLGRVGLQLPVLWPEQATLLRLDTVAE
jgi:alpha-galactosidase